MLTAFSVFSQSISNDFESFNDVEEWKADTLFHITAEQLRATVKIFSEHQHLLSENELLNIRTALLERSGRAKDYIIQSQQTQINTLNGIVVRKDAMLMNNDAVIDGLKKQVATEQKDRKKYFLYGAGAGAVVVGVIVAVLR